MIEMFIATFLIMKDGEKIGEINSPEPISYDECIMTLESDKPTLIKIMKAHEYENIELIGSCEPVGDPI